MASPFDVKEELMKKITDTAKAAAHSAIIYQESEAEVEIIKDEDSEQ